MCCTPSHPHPSSSKAFACVCVFVCVLQYSCNFKGGGEGRTFLPPLPYFHSLSQSRSIWPTFFEFVAKSVKLVLCRVVVKLGVKHNFATLVVVVVPLNLIFRSQGKHCVISNSLSRGLLPTPSFYTMKNDPKIVFKSNFNFGNGNCHFFVTVFS